MDYGRRVYGTKSENYVTFMSEITDKYVQSIGGKFTAGTKQPYLHDDYFSMQYIYNLKKKYLGGTPAATLEDLGVTPVIVPEVSNLNTLFSVDFDGTYADSISGLLPIGFFGENYLTTYSGKSCVRLHDAGLGTSRIFWYPVSNVNNQSFSLSWNSLGGTGCYVACGIGVYASLENVVVGFSKTGNVGIGSTDKNGTTLINYSSPTVYYSDGVWYGFNVILNNGVISVKLDNNIILTQSLDIPFLSNINTIGIYIMNSTATSVNAYFDSIKVENVIG